MSAWRTTMFRGNAMREGRIKYDPSSRTLLEEVVIWTIRILAKQEECYKFRLKPQNMIVKLSNFKRKNSNELTSFTFVYSLSGSKNRQRIKNFKNRRGNMPPSKKSCSNSHFPPQNSHKQLETFSMTGLQSICSSVVTANTNIEIQIRTKDIYNMSPNVIVGNGAIGLEGKAGVMAHTPFAKTAA